ncbi:TAR DNA-binding protein 43 [Exaiptasia diaphana]|uniref:RRM domain-containing protein n=1 Tax=Exaiptasia diaphana TaxID=2652724 RepID=A0A913X3R8_EXADI|nr:TAR DNA-binding protein 43 [Exaiptasia diaphana]
MFIVVPSKIDTASKRKIEESPTGKEPETKITKVEGIGDLIVLGLPYRTTEPEMKAYFSQFGELDYCEVKMDPVAKRSRGFGFVRFLDDEHAKNVLSMSHRIQGRSCEVRLPRTREEMNVPKKIFVGRLPEGAAEKELQEYFGQFGELTDVYIPKPNRNFGFVTFSSGEIAQSVVHQNHRMRDNLLNVSFAEPKSNSMKAMTGGGYPGSPNMGYNVWNAQWSRNQQNTSSNTYNAANTGTPYSIMNMMNPGSVQVQCS